MLGIVVILLISWLLLHFIESKNLNVLGVLPIKKSLIEFGVGLLFIIVLTLIVIHLDSWFLSIEWKMNSKIDYMAIIQSIWYNLKSAVTEDLIFRGAILYILVSKLGLRTGVIISATVFGVYHWFSFGMLPGDFRLFPLLYIFIITGSAGYVWAYAYIKTKSIMMPLGFHLGANFVLSLYFENAPYGELLFSKASTEIIENQWLNLLYLILKGVSAPLITYLFIKFWVRKNA